MRESWHSNTWNTASTSLQLFISMVCKVILPREPLPYRGGFTGHLKEKRGGHSITSFGGFSQGFRIAIGCFGHTFKALQDRELGCGESFCKFVTGVPSDKVGKSEVVKLHTHPDVWATHSSRVFLFLPLSYCLSLHPYFLTPKATHHMDTNIYTTSTQHSQWCPALTLGVSPNFPCNTRCS